MSSKYNNLSKEELIVQIEEMQETIVQIKKIANGSELESLPWIGSLGHWHWMISSNKVVFNDKKATNLGYKKSEIPKDVGFEYFTSKLHPDDYDRVMNNMEIHLKAQSDVYEVEYRIQKKNGSYVWYYDRGQVTKRDKDGNPLNISGIVFDITKNKVMETNLRKTVKKLHNLVITDELTGAYNRRYMIGRINEEINHNTDEKIPFSLIMLDVDDFKSVNDAYGHNTGDVVLKVLVDTINSTISEPEILARWGGEEFVILLPKTNLEDASKIAEKIRSKLAETVIEDLGSITASFGVANYLDDETLDETIKRADDLMYRAKSEGKNRVKY